MREIQSRGPGDYLVVAPTFKILNRKALPEFQKLFEQWMQLGVYQTTPIRKFVFTPEADVQIHGSHNPDHPTIIHFGHADDPESLEAMTAKAAWCDEAGMRRFRLGSWEAIQRRLSIHQGRALLTTTPYDLGWVKQVLHDAFLAGDPDVDLIRFESIMNPAFPVEEFERARRTLPTWKFDMFFRAIYTRPAGLIYEDFHLDKHLIDPFLIPLHWKRFVGLDFGGANTAATFWAHDPGHRRMIGYREYHAGDQTAAGHVKALVKGEPRLPTCVGGSKSEGQWRKEFAAAGLPVLEPPVSEVEVGIDRVIQGIKAGHFYIMRGTMPGLLDELGSYSRPVDELGNVLEGIVDKHIYHKLDSCRYIWSWMERPAGQRRRKATIPGQRQATVGSSGRPGSLDQFHPEEPVRNFR